MPRPIVGKLTSGELVLLVELLKDSAGRAEDMYGDCHRSGLLGNSAGLVGLDIDTPLQSSSC